MKKTLLLLLIISTAIAGSALQKSDFSVQALYGPHQLIEGENTIDVLLTIRSQKQVSAYGVVLSFNPQTPKLVPSQHKLSEAIIQKNVVKIRVTAKESGTYDLSNAFEIVSWDDSVTLNLNELPKTSSTKTITISGWTDPATHCKEHNYTGFWSERENCQVKLTVGNEEHWAERSGAFSFNHELTEGENRIDIQAIDPGGNTQETVLMITYAPPFLEKNKTLLLTITVVTIFIILGLLTKRILDMNKIIEDAKKTAINAITAARLEDLLNAEKQMLQMYMRSGGNAEIIKQLIPVWEKIIQTNPQLKNAAPLQDYSQLILQINPYIKTLPRGVQTIVLEQYNRILKKRKPTT